MKPAVRVLVEAVPQRKGWHWRQVGRTGATGAVSPKTYDTKALARRAGQRQVDVLNGAPGHYGLLRADELYAVLVLP